VHTIHHHTITEFLHQVFHTIQGHAMLFIQQFKALHPWLSIYYVTTVVSSSANSKHICGRHKHLICFHRKLDKLYLNSKLFKAFLSFQKQFKDFLSFVKLIQSQHLLSSLPQHNSTMRDFTLDVNQHYRAN